MMGDEAYAGALSFDRLQDAVRETLGLDQLVPAHNGRGAEKLLVTTSLRPGQAVLHNRGSWGSEFIDTVGGISVDVVDPAARELPAADRMAGGMCLEKLEHELTTRGPEGVAYVHFVLCPPGWNGAPAPLTNIRAVRDLCTEHGAMLVLDGSRLATNCWWQVLCDPTAFEFEDVLAETVKAADVFVLDAAQDAHSDIGAFLWAKEAAVFERLRNQVVVYEGLHTYGGMTGRAMEVLAVGLRQMVDPVLTAWRISQVRRLHNYLVERDVPCILGGVGVALDCARFLPHILPQHFPRFTLGAVLFVKVGLRGPCPCRWVDALNGPMGRAVVLEVPMSSLTDSQLNMVARGIVAVYEIRDQITGLRLCGSSVGGSGSGFSPTVCGNTPEFVDEAIFEPGGSGSCRLFVHDAEPPGRLFDSEPWKVAVWEPVRVPPVDRRRVALEEAGYNSYLLSARDIFIDLLTDSGNSALSTYQWEGMADTNGTLYSSRQFFDLEAELREVLGYGHVIPTHMCRAAEHIMSTVMIQEGQLVPGNMYFPTTKAHQEMAGGVFRDVIRDEAHDVDSVFPWKGNIDVAKLQALIDEVGPEGVAYVSFELCVNNAGGQPASMANIREVSELCRCFNIPLMFDATRCIENAHMIKLNDPDYRHARVRDVLKEMLSYGDGCTISAKKDFLTSMGGVLACNDASLARQFRRMLRVWEGEVTNGGLDPRDMEALRRGLGDALNDTYISWRIAQTHSLGNKLMEAGVPIVRPPGSHAIFLDARRFLPHVPQSQFPAQALSAAMYLTTGVRGMEMGGVSKGRDPVTGENVPPTLELVRLTIPRRVYSNSQLEYVVRGLIELYEARDKVSGLEFVYEPRVMRFFQSRFRAVRPWGL